MSFQTPTPTERLLSAADGIRQVTQTLELDPVLARELLTALAGNVQWIADSLGEK